jgi:hypothetical protein
MQIMNQTTPSVLTQFNSTLLQFLDELGRIFPCSKASKYRTMVNMSLTVNKSLWLASFMESSVEHGEHIMNSNEHYFLDSDLDFGKKLDLKKYYNMSNEETRQNMWKYIQTLYLLGCAFNGYTPEFLNTVSRVADKNRNDVSTENIINTVKNEF